MPLGNFCLASCSLIDVRLWYNLMPFVCALLCYFALVWWWQCFVLSRVRITVLNLCSLLVPTLTVRSVRGSILIWWCKPIDSSKDQLLNDLDRLLYFSQKLGIIMDWDKSKLVPRQRITYLAMLVDSVTATVFPVNSQINKLRERAEYFVSRHNPPARLL